MGSELSVPAGHIPLPIINVCCNPFNRALPEVTVAASSPVIPTASGPATKARPRARAKNRFLSTNHMVLADPARLLQEQL